MEISTFGWILIGLVLNFVLGILWAIGTRNEKGVTRGILMGRIFMGIPLTALAIIAYGGLGLKVLADDIDGWR